MLKISLIQMCSEAKIEANVSAIKGFLSKTKGDIIFFPELALTGYEMDLTRLNQQVVYKAISEIQALISRDQGVFLGGPFYQDQRIYNSIYFITKQEVKVVAKKYLLFPKLDDAFSSGYERNLVMIDDLRIGTIICFELRAPEMARTLIKEGANVIAVFAQWPRERISHWEVLLNARAVENQCYVIGVNALGGSMVVSPKGERLCYLGEVCNVLEEVSIPRESLKIHLPYPLKTPFTKVSEKLKTLEELKRLIKTRREKGQIMVFTNGCFDILHAGHVDYLEKARALGDFLVVGINSDLSVKKIKGPARPINNEILRVKTLSGLECVDYIILFDEETPEILIKELEPDILVKGADWEEEKIVGASFVKSYGGKVMRINFNYDISTTKIITKIKES